MGLIIQQRALQAAGGLRQVLPVVRKRDKSLFDQIHRAMNSVVLNIAEADGNDPGTAKARFASACGSAKEVGGRCNQTIPGTPPKTRPHHTRGSTSRTSTPAPKPRAQRQCLNDCDVLGCARVFARWFDRRREVLPLDEAHRAFGQRRNGERRIDARVR